MTHMGLTTQTYGLSQLSSWVIWSICDKTTILLSCKGFLATRLPFSQEVNCVEILPTDAVHVHLRHLNEIPSVFYMDRY